MSPEAESGKPSNAVEWMGELADAGLTPAQRAALADWLRDSPVNVRELVEVTLLNRALSDIELPREQVDTWVAEARASSSESNISSLAASTSVRRAPARSPRHVFAAVAFSMALALAAGVAWFQWQEGRFSTSLGEQRTLTLADGSVVTLNTRSLLKVHFEANQREIRLLRGEAFFRVAHDETRPFVVTANGASVRAVGTEFNVRLAPQAALVSVVDGRVRVSASNDKSENAPGRRPVYLSRGEEARIDHRPDTQAVQNAVIEKVPQPAAHRATAWLQGRIEFEATPLEDVLTEFTRYRALHIQIDDSSIRELKLTGSFDAHDPASVLAYISTIPGLAVEQLDRDAYVIRRTGQQQ